MIEHPGDLCKCGQTRAAHPAEGCDAWHGLHCHDCPDLDLARETAGERCCRDKHLDRRKAGDTREWEGIEAARQIDADEAALDADLSRQGKRAKARKNAKARK